MNTIEKHNDHPLSTAQHGIWLGQQKQPHSSCYNTAELFRVRGEVDLKRLRFSVARVLTEAACLHFSLALKRGVLTQRYRAPRSESSPNWTTEIQFKTVFSHEAVVSAPPSEDTTVNVVYRFQDQACFRAWQEYWLAQVIPIMQSRPFRHALVQLGDGDFAWFLQIHHLACDGFSYALLGNALQRHYANAGSDLDEQAVMQGLERYLQLIDAPCDDESSAQCRADFAYWCAQYATHNPYSFKAARLSQVAPASGCRHELHMPSNCLPALKDAARELSGDWPSLLKAVVAHWYQINTSEPHICFACPDMNRALGSAMMTPGLQMNILPLSVQFKKDDTLISIAKRIQTTDRAHKKHRRYRYEHFPAVLKEAQKTDEAASIRQPVREHIANRPFGPVMNLLPFHRHLHLDNTELHMTTLAAGPVEDIAFYFTLGDQNDLLGHIEFHPELYDKYERQWISAHFSRYLQALFERPSTRLAGPALRGETPHKKMGAISVMARLEQQRDQHGHKTALRWLSEDGAQPQWQNMSYHRLCAHIVGAAETLGQSGLIEGDKCLIAADRGPWTIIALLGCLALRAEFILVDCEGPEQRLQTIVADAQPKVVIVAQPEWLHAKSVQRPAGCKILTMATLMGVKEHSDRATARALHGFSRYVPDALAAYSIYTSGSTGAPKAVQISQLALSQFIVSANSVYAISSEDTVLQFAPMHFDACIEEIFISLSVGATLCIRPQNLLENLGYFNRVIRDQGISILDLPTAFFHEWARFNKNRNLTLPDTLASVIIGGEACSANAVGDFFATNHSVRLINTYGPSEATVVASAKVLTAENWRRAHSASIGVPLPGRSAWILDEQQKPLPRGVVGQLALSGDSLANGYYAQDALTRQKFIVNNNTDSHERQYLTGDLAAISDADELIFYGRIDDEIKMSGQRVHPAEVRAAIEPLLPGQSFAVAVIDRQHQPRFCVLLANDAYGELAIHKKNTEIQQRLRTRLPDVCMPLTILQIHALPLSPSGKIDHVDITRRIEAFFSDTPCAQSADQASENILESASGHDTQAAQDDPVLSQALHHVLGVWRSVLGLTDIRPEDDFFVLGGSSLQLLQVATRLNERNDDHSRYAELNVSDLFRYPKALDLAKKAIELGSPTTTATRAERLDVSPIALPKELQAAFVKTERKAITHVLLTGSTGFFGIHLLNALLNELTDTPPLRSGKIICLIRAESVVHAREKLARACEKHALADISYHPSVEIVLGDLAQADWGLDSDQLDELCHSLSAVLHNAAVISLVRDYQSLKPINVDATLTALTLAHRARSPIHYISTIAVADHTPLPEDFIEQHRYLIDGYQKSKWASEQLLKQRAACGQPFSIYRLPRVVGSATTGTINPHDLLWRIVAAGQRAKALPDLTFDEPWLEADVIARFIARRVIADKTGFFNCMPSESVSLATLLKKVSRIAQLPIRAVPEWLQTISTSQHSEDQALLTFFHSRKDDAGERAFHIQCPNFLRSASGDSLTAPPLDTYLHTALAQRIIEPAAQQIISEAKMERSDDIRN